MKDLIQMQTNAIFDRKESDLLAMPAGYVSTPKKTTIISPGEPEKCNLNNLAIKMTVSSKSRGENMARIGEMIETEIDKHIKSKKWNYLPKCVKWIKIQNYAETHSMSNRKINNLKKLISGNKLSEISYDHHTGEIKEIPPHYLKVNAGL